MLNWWKRLQDRRIPKVQMGGSVKIMYGETVVGVVVLTEFSTTYQGGTEARFIDVASYQADRCVSR